MTLAHPGGGYRKPGARQNILHVQQRACRAALPEISKYQKRRFGLEYDPQSEVIVTIGGSEAIDLALRTIVCPGDEVILPVPAFVCYEPLIKLAGGTRC